MCVTLSWTWPHSLHFTSPGKLVCVLLLEYSFVDNRCSYSSNTLAIVYERHDLHLFSQLKPSFLHSCKSDFPCHSSSRTYFSSFFSTHYFNISLTRYDGMMPPLPILAHTGFGWLRCKLTPRSSGNIAASLTKELCPSDSALSSNSLTISIAGSLFSYNLTTALILVTLYSVSTANRCHGSEFYLYRWINRCFWRRFNIFNLLVLECGF